MNILVTGSNGQLGNEIRQASINSINNYIFTDIAELDITDLASIDKMVNDKNIKVIINCAAYTNVDKAEDDYLLANLINNKAVENLSVATKKAKATLIHISTDYVFKGDKCIPCKEDWETSPLGVYGETKLAGEQAILKTDCKHLIFRTAWLYSTYGNNFVKTMQRLTAERDTLKVVFDQVGTPTYAQDLATTICKIIEENMLDKQGIYHFSNEGVCSWYDFAQEICKFSDNECDIQPCYSNEFISKVKRPHFSVLDKTKVKEAFGITIPYWKESLRKCIDKLKNEPHEL